MRVKQVLTIPTCSPTCVHSSRGPSDGGCVCFWHARPSRTWVRLRETWNIYLDTATHIPCDPTLRDVRKWPTECWRRIWRPIYVLIPRETSNVSRTARGGVNHPETASRCVCPCRALMWFTCPLPITLMASSRHLHLSGVTCIKSSLCREMSLDWYLSRNLEHEEKWWTLK